MNNNNIAISNRNIELDILEIYLNYELKDIGANDTDVNKTVYTFQLKCLLNSRGFNKIFFPNKQKEKVFIKTTISIGLSCKSDDILISVLNKYKVIRYKEIISNNENRYVVY